MPFCDSENCRGADDRIGRGRRHVVRLIQIRGCPWLSLTDAVDVGGRERTRANVYGRPQTVLKTAGPASMDARNSPPEMLRHSPQSAEVRCRPPEATRLAVYFVDVTDVVSFQPRRNTLSPDGLTRMTPSFRTRRSRLRS